jgi:glycosyltransferase involved in cell wall biosynthesis
MVIGIGLILHGIYTNLLGTLFKKKKILLLMGKNDLALNYPEKKILRRLLLKVTSLADLVGTRGTGSMAWLTGQGFAEERIFIPHNVFDFDEFAPEKDPIKKYDMIFVGVLRQYKRVDLLIEVVGKLVRCGLNGVKLAVVGDGPLKESLMAQAEALGVRTNVCFFPFGNAAYVRDLLNQAKIFVMTSQGEGLPMAVVEAMSCGLPVVAFDDADIGDVVQHRESGFLVENGDLGGFARAVQRLLEDRDLYERLARNSPKIRRDRGFDYSMQSVISTWDDNLVALVSEKSSGLRAQEHGRAHA